jgi:hypothetical protein
MKFIAIFFSLMLYGCHQSHCDLADAEMVSFAKKKYDERHLAIAGFGGAMMNDIQGFEMHFDSPEHLSLSEARKLMIQTIAEFVEQVNQNPKIRPHLHNYPINAKNISLMIGFEDKNGPPSKEYIALLSCSEGKVFYSHWDPEAQKFHQYCDRHSESFNDAVRIVMEEENRPELARLLLE